MNLHFQAPILSRSGYGTLARGFCLSLSQELPEFSVENIADFPGGTLRIEEKIRRCVGTMQRPDDSVLRLDVPWRKRYDMHGTEGCTIIYTMFEAPVIRKDWKAGLIQFSGLITPSRFSENIFRDAGCSNVHTVRPGFFRDHFNRDIEPLHLQTRSQVFLFVGEYNYRKGLDIAVRAFARAFSDHDDVSLVVKTWSSMRNEQEIRKDLTHLLDKEAGGRPAPHLLVLQQMLPDELMPALYRAASVLLMPSRSEAFGLPALEAQACGVPVIASNATGLAELVDHQSGYLIPAINQRPAPWRSMIGDFYEGALFPEPDEEALVDLLKKIAADQATMREKGKMAFEKVKEQTWNRASGELLSLLRSQGALPP